jgi:hypothetical protein
MRFEVAASFACVSTGRPLKPSKPWGCGSSRRASRRDGSASRSPLPPGLASHHGWTSRTTRAAYRVPGCRAGRGRRGFPARPCQLWGKQLRRESAPQPPRRDPCPQGTDPNTDVKHLWGTAAGTPSPRSISRRTVDSDTLAIRATSAGVSSAVVGSGAGSALMAQSITAPCYGSGVARLWPKRARRRSRYGADGLQDPSKFVSGMRVRRPASSSVVFVGAASQAEGRGFEARRPLSSPCVGLRAQKVAGSAPVVR